MPSFEDLGLRVELLRTLEDEEVDAPTALQAAVIPALRRGGNVVARASSGAGKTLSYLLGIFDRLEIREEEEEGETGLRLLILTPTSGEAERAALAAIPYAQSIGLLVAVPGSGWGTPVSAAHMLVAAAGDVMTAVRSSAVKLDRLEAVVVDGASTIVDLGDWDEVDDLLDLVPRDAQRVLVTPALTDAVEDVIERRVKRALRYPAGPALASPQESIGEEGEIGYVLVPAREKLELLAMQLRDRRPGSSPPIIFCRNDERAADLAEKLSVRGFLVGQGDDEEADVAIAAGGATLDDFTEDLEGERGQTISYDVPPDAATLRARHRDDADGVVLVEPRELAHLREIARQANFRARSTPFARDIPASAASLETFRNEIRAALRQEDLTAQMLVLEPLFEEFTAHEIAAAATALLRSRHFRNTAPVTVSAASERGPGRPNLERNAPTGPAPATWARLFVSVGSRDEIRPGDLVGAIAGEAGIPGSRIGKIEIRDSFSIVEVQADVADQVIRAVNGTTMKGRSLRVDYDRGGPAKRPPARGGAGPRRTVRQPPTG